MKFNVYDDGKFKVIRSKYYNYNFDYITGYFERWGKDKNDDPLFSPIGPEILDMEISVNGCPNNCEFCYKGNTNIKPTNMSFKTFKKIIDNMPKTLTQIAFGICGVQTNPDFIKMLKYSREKNIVPNFTLSGIDLTDELAKEIVKYIGAVAVSVYETNKNICYDTVKKFIDLGIEQTNIHLLSSKNNEKFMYEVLNDIKIDKRLKKLNAVVLLKLKPKGRSIENNYKNLSLNEYEELIEYCFDKNIPLGFDSCTCPEFEYVVRKTKKLNNNQKKEMLEYSESCESFGLFSSYINVNADYFPCSFAEDEGEWKEGINVLDCDFLKDVWYNKKLNKWRKKSLNTCYKSGCRKCLIYDINPEYEV